MIVDREEHKRRDRLARWWLACGEFLAHRPVQTIAVMLGVTIMAVTFAISVDNKVDITTIEDALCNRPGETYTTGERRQCQTLLDKLLQNPTPEQQERLRNIVKGESP